MATLVNNVIHLTIDSYDVCAYFTEVDLNPSNSSIDITAGCGAEHVERAAGLNDTKLSIKLVYDDVAIANYIQKLKPGVHTVEFGPEGSGSGKPRHQQSFNFTSVSAPRKVGKDKVEFSISGEGAAAPTYDLYAGATFS